MLTASVAIGAGIGSPSTTPSQYVRAIEYYHAGLDHYFMTANPNEAASLDSGATTGWTRTGVTFDAYSTVSTTVGITPTCRFYGRPSAGLDSHFYSGSPAECADVARKFSASWQFESGNVFQVMMPDPVSGACPSDSKPVYRIFNNRTDANHRYVLNIPTRDQMRAAGYIAEGYGPDGVAFCAATDPSTPPTTANAAPVARIATPNINGLSIAVSGAPSSDSDGGIVAFVWDFGDGTFDTGVAIGHTYSAAGTYTVRLLVTDDKGASGTATTTVVVAPGTTSTPSTPTPTTPTPGTGGPAAHFAITQTASDTFLFNAQTSVPPAGGTIASYAWDFGDGTFGSGVANVHKYKASGTYLTTLIVTDNRGETARGSAALTSAPTSTPSTTPTPTPTPSAPPTAAITVTQTAADTFVFSGAGSVASAGNIALYAWDFGDGMTSTGVAVSHAYANSGVYTVRLTVTDIANALGVAIASVNAVVAAPAPTPAGLPSSADFITLASDPRGGDNGYNTFKRLPDGRGITFGGFSHDRKGNNAVAVYDPRTNTWQVPVPNTPWVEGPTLPDGSMDVRGRSYLGNRDNHLTMVVGNAFWVMSGERGINLTGNYSGRLDLSTWKWSIDDTVSFAGQPASPEIDTSHWINSAAGTLPDGTAYVFGGDHASNPWDGLWMRKPDGTIREFWNIWNAPAFPGAEKLRYISNSHFVRNGKIFVYGGIHEFREMSLGRENGKTLYAIDAAATVPSMAVTSVNTVPVGKRVEGLAVFAYYVAAKDLMVATDGTNINVYDFATNAWYYVPLNTPPDANRTDYGAGFYSPEVNLGIVEYRHAKVYGLRLNYGSVAPTPTPTPTPAPTTVSCTLQASNSTPAVGTAVALTTSCAGSPTYYVWTGCASTSSSCSATSASATSVTYTVSASNGTSTSGPVSTTVSWQAASAPPPTASTGSLKATTTTIPYTGFSRALASSKHLDFARFNGRWYKMAGDHAVISGGEGRQDGRQEILSVNFAVNDWTLEQPYFAPNGAMQIALPDDAFAVTRQGEIWSFVSERVEQSNTATRTAAMRAQFPTANVGTQDMEDIGAWNPVTKTWRAILPRPHEMWGDRAWRGTYDSVKDRFVIPVTQSTLIWLLIGGNGVDQTPRRVDGSAIDSGDHDFHAAGIVGDPASRLRYVYDANRGQVWSVNLDTLALTLMFTIPEGHVSGEAGIQLVWHGGLNALVLFAGDNGGTLTAPAKMYIYEIDTAKLTTLQRQDGFLNASGHWIPASTALYDPDTGSIISIGGIDWDGMQGPGFWRMTITR